MGRDQDCVIEFDVSDQVADALSESSDDLSIEVHAFRKRKTHHEHQAVCEITEELSGSSDGQLFR